MISASGMFRLALGAGLMGAAALVKSAFAEDGRIPGPLRAWEDWAAWDAKDRGAPTPYSDPKTPLAAWPSRLTLQIDAAGGRFDLGAMVFREAWISLPGGRDAWPLDVKANGLPVPVLEHDGRPAIRLAAGAYRLEGAFRWNEVPPSLPVPPTVGVVSLMREGRPVEAPAWDAEGTLWLKRDAAPGDADKDFLAVKISAAIDDGIPLWLHTEIELVVAGKSREEEIGGVLPAGWKLAAVDAPIPVAVDDAGRLKAQVRAGKWKVRLEAFRLDDPKEFAFAPGVKPAVAEELVAFRPRPDFRLVDITGAPSIDVSQTTFPEQWRDLPVYRWDPGTPFRLEERMRGMGLQKPAGLTIARELWLDDAGRGLTFRDRITARRQQIWRLDAAPGQDIGSVRSGGEGQLITRDPVGGAPGVEIRTRSVDLEATGRMDRTREISATGWRADADSLRVTLNLPPGWRLFALFGADWVSGDWLTAWTLLDLFLLLIFSLAVFRLWGVGPALVAFLAFGISFHEPGAPRYVWLILLLPLALLRVVPAGWGRRLLHVWKWLTVLALVLILAPFASRQIQQAIYPQLEDVGGFPGAFGNASTAAPASPAIEVTSNADGSGVASRTVIQNKQPGNSSGWNSNLLYDAKARIQTGPGVPEWSWRVVTFGWNGPVAAAQQVRPILIPRSVEQILTVLRVALLLALAAILLDARRLRGALFRAPGKAALALAALWLAAAPAGRAQTIPDRATLDQLRDRLLEPSPAYPNAAEIPTAALALNDRHLAIDVEIHAALRVAVPLPGRLPAWSPVTVTIDGQPAAALRRDDGFLWVVVEPGVHRARVEGLLADATEWEWTFQLRPRRVTIDAPGWTFSGVRPDGVPDQQVFFARQQKSTAGEASYDQQKLQTLVTVDRHLELGLVWQVRTTVSRLSADGRAIALRVPLLAGENVLSSDAVVRDGFIDVRLGAHDGSFEWVSELSVADKIVLATRAGDSWVERWWLVASPVWNAALSGLAPVFEPGDQDLIPVWHPWPGESAALAISRPQAIAGATVTVRKVTHAVELGKRQRDVRLDLALRCSLGEDFLVDLPAGAEITSLTQDGRAIPVRKTGPRLIVPVHPGEQAIAIAWKTNVPLGFRAKVDAVRLPVESANIETTLHVPEDRWVLWTDGPRRGPAVRFWVILACSLLAAIVLGRIAHSPLRPAEWLLLALGLTQVPLPAAFAVVGWLFFLSWRGRESFGRLPAIGFNLLQLFLIALTALALGIFVVVVGQGLLGAPEMFIVGNGSTPTGLSWFQARGDGALPVPDAFSVSIWWYRFLMLAWALWLAASLIRWLAWAWRQFSAGGCFRRGARKMPSAPSA